MKWELPIEWTPGEDLHFPIRADYRVALDIFSALNDPDLDDGERGMCVLYILFPTLEDDIPKEMWPDALKFALWFLNGGEEHPSNRRAKIMDWDQDAAIIIPAVNRVAGHEVRAIPYDDGLVTATAGLHWWTFLGYYQEIGGECTFAQVIRIRDKRARGKNLDKEEREYYRLHQDLVDLQHRYSKKEKEFLQSLKKG